MKNLIFILSFIFISTLSIAQVNIAWETTFGDEGEEGAHNIVESQNGGYYVVGYTDSQGNGRRDGWVIKIKDDGTEEWNATFGGPQDEEIYDLIELSDGNIAMIGYTSSQGKGKEDMWFLIADNKGNTVYSESFGGDKEDIGKKLFLNTEGDYIFMGHTQSKGPGKSNFWVMRYKPDLSPAPANGGRKRVNRPVWDRYVGGAKFESSHQIRYNPNDSLLYVIGQSSTYSNGSMDVYLVTISSDLGRVKDRKNFGQKQYDNANDIIINEDGSMMIFGETMSNSNGLYDGYITYIFKDHFYQEWAYNIGGTKDDRFISAVTSKDGYLIAGYTMSEGEGGYDGWLVEVDKKGEVLWQETVGDVENDKFKKIFKTKDGGHILCGTTYSDDNKDDMWVIKLAK